MLDRNVVSDPYVEFQTAVLKALPRDMSDDLCRDWAGKGEALTEVLAAALLPMYPADGEVLDLTIAKPFTGLEMVRDDGFTGNWRFTGKEITQPQTKRFKLVSIGYQLNFEAVERELAKHGTIPQGQWRKVFKKAYPKPDGRGPIGVADASWVDPLGGVYFPYVHTDGDENFDWTDSDFNDDWRWLVGVK